MDVYWGAIGPIVEQLDSRLPALIEGLGEGHHPSPATSEHLRSWQHEAGESVLLNVDGLEILFDGYVHGTVEPDFEEFLTGMARRVIDRAPLLRSGESGLFNVVVVDAARRSVHLANDPGGLFPLYFGSQGESFWWASHLHLVARGLRSRPDMMGVLSEIAFGYTLGSRTAYDGIERLNAGERVTWRDGRIERAYVEPYFTGYGPGGGKVADDLWDALSNAARPLADSGRPMGVMLSEGFDSRLVAGTLRSLGIELETFTHGSAETAGAQIIRDVCAVLGATSHFYDMPDGYPNDLDSLRNQLLLADNLHIPYWSYGTRHFADSGVAAVTTGYALDTTIGGHAFYRNAGSNRQRVLRRFQEMASQDAGLLSERRIEELSSAVLDEHRDVPLAKVAERVGLFLVPEVAEVVTADLASLPDEVDAEIRRVQSSGSSAPSLAVQRYFLENRVRKFSFGQELTLRMVNRVRTPSFEPAFMKVLSTVPPTRRIQHKAYIELMRRHLPDLARVPNGGFGLPVTWPRWVLEGSRAVMKRREDANVRAYLAARGGDDVSWYRGVNFAEQTARRTGHFAVEDIVARPGSVLNPRYYDVHFDRLRNYGARVFLVPIYQGLELTEMLSEL